MEDIKLKIPTNAIATLINLILEYFNDPNVFENGFRVYREQRSISVGLLNKIKGLKLKDGKKEYSVKLKYHEASQLERILKNELKEPEIINIYMEIDPKL